MASGEAELTDPGQIISIYKQLTSECQKLMSKGNELELDLTEHELVLEKIRGLESSRRAYRLIGGVLVEKTVGEIVPSITEHAENLKMVIKQVYELLAKKEAETQAWKEKYKIRAQTAKEIRAQQEAAEAEEGGGSGGVLA